MNMKCVGLEFLPVYECLYCGGAGLEGGSGRLSGGQLMELWDRLCRMLRTRGVSVEDVSNKVCAPVETLLLRLSGRSRGKGWGWS